MSSPLVMSGPESPVQAQSRVWMEYQMGAVLMGDVCEAKSDDLMKPNNAKAEFVEPNNAEATRWLINALQHYTDTLTGVRAW